jgi:hypothetical protein
VVFEPAGDQAYWRLYLRCQKQDGSMGRPLKVRPWDLTADARRNLRGGRLKPIPGGYYVDLTDLLARYDWSRIPSDDSPDFHWHTSFVALEYWHFENTGGLRWYEAMLELFPPDLMAMHHSWEIQQGKDLPAWLAAEKGIPLPWSERRVLEMLAP